MLHPRGGGYQSGRDVGWRVAGVSLDIATIMTSGSTCDHLGLFA